jgi:hypothetical protein
MAARRAAFGSQCSGRSVRQSFEIAPRLHSLVERSRLRPQIYPRWLEAIDACAIYRGTARRILGDRGARGHVRVILSPTWGNSRLDEDRHPDLSGDRRVEISFDFGRLDRDDQ